MVDNNFFGVVYQRLTHPDTIELVKRALAQGVVFDTWMNGENEEQGQWRRPNCLSSGDEAMGIPSSRNRQTNTMTPYPLLNSTTIWS